MVLTRRSVDSRATSSSVTPAPRLTLAAPHEGPSCCPFTVHDLTRACGVGLREYIVLGGFQAPFLLALAHRLLLSAPTAAIA